MRRQPNGRTQSGDLPRLSSDQDPLAALETLLEFAPDATVAVDGDGVIVLSNAQAEALFGYTREELIGRSIELLVPERFRRRHVEQRAEFGRNPHTRPMESNLDLYAVRRGGNEFPAEISLARIDTELGVLTASAIRDVGERRRAEENQARLAAIVESSDDAIVGKSVDGLITDWNHSAERLYGFSADEAIGQPIDIVVPPDRAGEQREILSTVLAGGKVEHFETQRLRKDGSLVDVSVAASPIRDRWGQVVGVSVIARDVSERVRSQRKFERFLEFAPDAIVGVGLGGKIEFVNAQAETLLGYRRDELYGQPVEVLVPQRFRVAHVAHRGDYFGDPKTRPMGDGGELCALRKDGSEFPAEISLSSIEGERGVLAIAALRDVTQRLEVEREKRRLEVEAQLSQSRRLESVGQLAGGIAHDFNNLLGVIINYAQFVADRVRDDRSVLDDVEEIQRAAKAGASLTRQLLVFSRREVMETKLVDLNDLVAELDRLLRRTLGEHVELETRLAPNVPAVVVDPGQIEQVLVNLAVNARDAMPDGGRLLIETSVVDLDEVYVSTHPDAETGRHVRLTVGDTGTGMDHDTLRRAVEPFFTTKSKAEGTGLGLATVYGVVTQAGGSLHIYSELGIGTTVRVHIPAAEGQPAPAAGAEAELPGGAGETVLLVEDERAVRNLTQRILAEHGYRVLVASGPHDALEICGRRGQPVDLLLSDVVMPEMLGTELAERALAMRPGLRVLHMSGYTPQVIAHEAANRQTGAAFIEKPFGARDLLEKVRAALS